LPAAGDAVYAFSVDCAVGVPCRRRQRTEEYGQAKTGAARRRRERIVAVYFARFDGVGSRLIGLANVIRVARKLNTEFFFWWPPVPHKHVGRTGYASSFFEPSFVSTHSLGAKPSDDEIEGMLGSAAIDAYARGAPDQPPIEEHVFLDGITVDMFDGEDAERVVEEIQSIFADLPFVARIKTAMEQAVAKFSEKIQGRVLGIHVRSGDILEYFNQVKFFGAKYLPIEYYRRAINKQADQFDHILLISNDPDVRVTLDIPLKKIITSREVLQDSALDELQVAMADLVMMGQCDAIFAPADSSFSKASTLFYGVLAVPVGSLFTGEEMFEELLDYSRGVSTYADRRARVYAAKRLSSLDHHEAALEEILPVVEQMEDDWIHQSMLRVLYPRCLWRAGQREKAIIAAEKVLALGIEVAPELFKRYARWIKERDPERAGEIARAVAGWDGRNWIEGQ
jgi:hypothetical protein